MRMQLKHNRACTHQGQFWCRDKANTLVGIGRILPAENVLGLFGWSVRFSQHRLWLSDTKMLHDFPLLL